MTTLSEERERNRRLKAEAEVRKDFISRNEELRKLKIENKRLERGDRPSSLKRIKDAFTPTMEIEVEGKKERRLKPGYKGFREFGRGVKEYAEHTGAAARKEEPSKRFYYKKIGKGRYKKVVVRKRQHRRPQRSPQTNFGYPQFGSKSNMFGQTDSLFRRTV